MLVRAVRAAASAPAAGVYDAVVTTAAGITAVATVAAVVGAPAKVAFGAAVAAAAAVWAAMPSVALGSVRFPGRTM